MQKIFRNDDINPNSNFDDIRKMYGIIKSYFPDAVIYSAVNVMSQTSENKSPYKKIKTNEIDFTGIDRVIDLKDLQGLENIVSHGLFHIDHRNSDVQLWKMSILASCQILKTNIFVPPFLRKNRDIRKFCNKHNIKILGIDDGEWINLDNNKIKKDHDLYCFHSWRTTPDEFKSRFILTE